jgi:hypothetical protein
MLDLKIEICEETERIPEEVLLIVGFTDSPQCIRSDKTQIFGK